MVFIPIAIPFVLGEYIISGRPGMTVPLVPGKALMELSVCIQTFLEYFHLENIMLAPAPCTGIMPGNHGEEGQHVKDSTDNQDTQRYIFWFN
ncbi:MAG: hypothetical protein K1W05_05785 [Desulfovibrio sp.]|jgi:hypothetical protein